MPTLLDTARRISSAGFESCAAEMVPEGAILMSSRAPIGHLAIAGVACCSNQGCKNFIPGDEVDGSFLYFALKLAVPELRALGSGATFAEISKSTVERFRIALPLLQEQKRLAAILKEQLAEVEAARIAAKAQLGAMSKLPTALFREAFCATESKAWSRKRVGDFCRLLPSKSIATEGDAEVDVATTACLSESGFLTSGIKKARMWSRDVGDCRLQPGEILIARSNTPELVGRAAMFRGEQENVVAADLTIRLMTGEPAIPAFLAFYLSFLYQTGYWKDRAGGASGSMKKITRSQVLDELVPLPQKADQLRVADHLTNRIATVEESRKAVVTQLELINRLPAAILRKAFNGEL